MILDHQEARRLFDYDPATGDLFRIVWRRGAVEKPCRRLTGTLRSDGYLITGYFDDLYFNHRVIHLWMTGAWPVGLVDHIDGNRVNNRWSNLRTVDDVGNGQNQGLRVTNTSGVIGVHYDHARGKWQAQITSANVHHHLGRFATLDEAIAARLAAERRFAFHPNHGKRQSFGATQ